MRNSLLSTLDHLLSIGDLARVLPSASSLKNDHQFTTRRTILPRVCPFDPCSYACRASERCSTVSTIGRMCPASINVPIWINCSRLGSTTNQTGRTLCAFASSKEGRGLTTETSTPPGFTTCQDRSKVSPPTVSKTRSTL